MSSRHRQSQGIQPFYFKIHISARCCLWYKKTEDELWSNSTHTSSCANDDNNQNHSFVPTRMQTGRQRTPNERTCFRIMEVCSASKKKSLQGLDNTSTAGIEAFETLETLVETLATNGAGTTWGRETAQRLRAGKKYLKCVYKCNLAPDEHCPDHCIQFALSDPGKHQFCRPCNHKHDLVCLQCQSIKEILNSLKEKVEN